MHHTAPTNAHAFVFSNFLATCRRDALRCCSYIPLAGLSDVEDPAEAADNCFAAAGIYAMFVVGTSILILRNNKRNRDAAAHRDSAEREGSSGAEMSGLAKEARLGSRGGGYGR